MNLNLLEQPVSLPLPRIVNGFRIVPEWIDESEQNYIWYILPNKTQWRFYFRNLAAAQRWATAFQNSHTDEFWSQRWIPLYAKHNVVNLALKMYGNN